MSEHSFFSALPKNRLRHCQTTIMIPKRDYSEILFEPIDIPLKNIEIKQKSKINLKKSFYVDLSPFKTEEDESNEFIKRENEDEILYKKQNMIRKIYLSRNEYQKRRRSKKGCC